MTQRRDRLSRRQFGTLAASAAAAPFLVSRPSAGAAAMTAHDLVDRIKIQLGGEWRPDSVDGLKAGDPSTVVTGIATTSMATLAVLQQAVKAGVNVVITAQPTFYAKSDGRNPPAGRGGGAAPVAGTATAAAPAPSAPADSIFAAKNDFISKNKLVVIRLSEHWKSRRPDPLGQGIAAALGWTSRQSAGDPQRYDLPALSLEALVNSVKKGLNSRGGIRVVGDPQTTVRRVGLLPGTTPIQAALTLLPTVDAILAGEVREWESVEYARDKAFAGERKGLILVGRVVSEEPGMNVCADWLRTFLSGVPVRHIPAGDPYWRPVA